MPRGRRSAGIELDPAADDCPDVMCLSGVPFLADPLLAFPGWSYLAVAYWWPLGWWLSRNSPRCWIRLLVGFLVSIPLYFAGLAAAYGAMGYHFAPRTAGM